MEYGPYEGLVTPIARQATVHRRATVKTILIAATLTAATDHIHNRVFFTARHNHRASSRPRVQHRNNNR